MRKKTLRKLIRNAKRLKAIIDRREAKRFWWHDGEALKTSRQRINQIKTMTNIKEITAQEQQDAQDAKLRKTGEEISNKFEFFIVGYALTELLEGRTVYFGERFSIVPGECDGDDGNPVTLYDVYEGVRFRSQVDTVKAAILEVLEFMMD